MYLSELLSFSQKPQEIDLALQLQTSKLNAQIEKVAQTPLHAATLHNALIPLEFALCEFSNALTPLIFHKYVSSDSDLRSAADRCENTVQQFMVDLFVREDLFHVIEACQKNTPKLTDVENRLLDEYLVSFKRNGLGLPKEKRDEFITKKKRLVLIESEYNNNLSAENTSVEFSLDELKGLPQSYIDSLEKLPNGNYKITLAYPHYFPFMDNAESAEARKRLEYHFHRRGGEKNAKLLNEALRLRQELANMLGFKTHADFVLDRRMAKTTSTVKSFLKDLEVKLVQEGKKELQSLSELKVKHTGNKSDPTIHPWDWRFYDNYLKKNKYQVDNEKVREYFPAETVLKGLFEIYQTLFSVTFTEVKQAPSWNSEVKKYRIERSGKAVAYFFTDLFPRDGKYGHAAAFTLVSGYQKEDGTYELPASAIVANFNPPTGDKPSLLDHGEVETLFHEFGHIMHQVLTQAKFPTFSGTSVKTDFVEAPSQMLENWVWSSDGLNRISGHYKNPSEKLPKALSDKLLALKNVNVGIRYLRQLSFATLDLEFHMATNPNPREIYSRVMKTIMQIPVQEGTIPEASFGHLMGGYDSGYYSYLWAEVFAQDLFTRFEKEGLLNPKTGSDYTKWILEPGGEKDPLELIEGFLGRKPSNEAFLKSIGI